MAPAINSCQAMWVTIRRVNSQFQLTYGASSAANATVGFDSADYFHFDGSHSSRHSLYDSRADCRVSPEQHGLLHPGIRHGAAPISAPAFANGRSARRGAELESTDDDARCADDPGWIHPLLEP